MSIEFQDQEKEIDSRQQPIANDIIPAAGLLGFLIKIKIVHTRVQATALVFLFISCFFIATGAIIVWSRNEAKPPMLRPNALSDSHAKK